MRGTTSHNSLRVRGSENVTDLEAVGGEVNAFLAAGTLLVGDVVYISAANTVAKSATVGDYVSYAGVVVGGKQTFGHVGTLAADVGDTAALVGELVLVQNTGKAWVTSDAAITVGARVSQGAVTAGRVDDVAGAATTSQTCGIALQAATGAAEVIQILITHA